MREIILYDELIKEINKKIIGKSVSFPCGWVQKDDLQEIIDNIR